MRPGGTRVASRRYGATSKVLISDRHGSFRRKLAFGKMGFFDRLAGLLGLRKKEVNVLVVGLNNSGKSTVINHFKREEERCIDIVPTVGFNVEKFACKLHMYR